MQPASPIPFTKMSGTGNDFILIDNRSLILAGIDLADFARRICRRNFSVGADGLIVINTAAGNADFAWDFYNADGSIAEMCGNGARCAARFAVRSNIAASDMTFETLAGTIHATVSGRQVKIGLTAPFDLDLERQITVHGNTYPLQFINTGVPHAVLFVDDNRTTAVQEWGKAIRFDPMFQPAGTNVNFVTVTDRQTVTVRTYERGVEGETLACGTGATAAAIVAALLDKVRPPVTVITSGGQRLIIHFSLTATNRVTNLFLEGPAHVVYEGILQPDALLLDDTA